ncbi:bifunctional oligoribonuclease/PAP phosphatase NrnA [bacterium]|nr:bifunctional oligoribonuclease/PAP phosphatase NrnA [bacterium]
MKPEIETAIRRAAEAIAAADSLAVTCHVNPDGDALGSALGFALAARAVGKKAVVSFPSPFVVPESYRFLDTSPLIPPDQFPMGSEMVVVFDVASPDRLGELAEPARSAETLIIVDHHVTNSGFGDITVIDPEASASAVLAYHLIRALDWPIDEASATALHLGIVTDTGRFQYSNTDGETLRVAADLVDIGAKPEIIGQSVYESTPFGYLQVSSAVLGRAVLEEDLGFVWSVVLDADVAAAGVRKDDLDSLIDDLRIAREAGAAALIKEVPGGFKVSLRSRGVADVGAIAAAGGGGGHHNASGFSTSAPLDEVVEMIRSHLRSG